MPYSKDPNELADTIASMTYGDLMEVCSELSEMVSAKDVRPTMTATEDFASLLWDWAEATREARAERAAALKNSSA